MAAQRRGLSGLFASNDGSNVRRQVEGDIATVRRARWRARFGTCMETRGHRHESGAGV
ncbi:MAG: hypothetical protein HOM52_10215 [Rhodospirillaceae bacterium]|nr:hypothetical protein [Rhodospirillaceae bacterium]MBT4428599.1 hypothetical protein [Rhodospirillaceae bacterium]MBT5038875.1 hypothetical protein [Rhodospirillaceae bacterium]MBT5674986.1 hypothetical protein [Rhodospirillaceae bacterium]MBT5779412.1 hypothetical protein [Rhodospirillaceae bacterium]